MKAASEPGLTTHTVASTKERRQEDLELEATLGNIGNKASLGCRVRVF